MILIKLAKFPKASESRRGRDADSGEAGEGGVKKGEKKFVLASRKARRVRTARTTVRFGLLLVFWQIGCRETSA
ncbi:hypothetical protein GWI33_004175 [Rhynchophorus ferrugineus]|uniref:Uncharacterized protein n=1 Tax=Rhynchophorus ferrugineus TaxID=354439 RepID=A0A834MEX1_RHYFE|nr:hypothetical protein GWI33_004175 [Rhynchophorus ferrugineus]